MIHQRHRRTDGQTDRRTDGQTTCDSNTALCFVVHRAVKTCLHLWVCLSVCANYHGRISWSIFTKIGTDVKNPKVKRVCWRQQRTTIFTILPQTSTLDHEVLKIRSNINYVIAALKHVCELRKLSWLVGNRGEGTWWLTSDFRPEVKIWPFCACTQRNITIIYHWVLNSYWLLIGYCNF